MAAMDSPLVEESVVEDEETIEPRNYKVLLHNDDITTMDFVVEILCRIFNKNHDDAETIMWRIHNNGIGLCGVYTKEIAETKVGQVHYAANNAGFPLRCTMEEE